MSPGQAFVTRWTAPEKGFRKEVLECYFAPPESSRCATGTHMAGCKVWGPWNLWRAVGPLTSRAVLAWLTRGDGISRASNNKFGEEGRR